MTPTLRIRTSVAAALVVLLSLSACSSDGSDGDSPSEAEASASAAAGSTGEGSEGPGSSGNSDTSGETSKDGNKDGEADTNDDAQVNTDEEPAPGESAAAAPPAGKAVTAAVTKQACKNNFLTITLTANYDNSYKKGIKSIKLERQNEYNAWLDYTANWLGPETGQGNQWTGQLVGNRQNIGKVLRVTVTPTSGSAISFTKPVSAPC